MKTQQSNDTFFDNVNAGTFQLIDNIKLILYKKDPSIFEQLDFENDEIYLEPILFAALNSKLIVDVNKLLIGFKNKEIQRAQVEMMTDQNGTIYLPNIGYFITSLPNSPVEISFEEKYALKQQGKGIDFKLEELVKIHEHFEVVSHPIYLLDEHFFDEFGTDVPVEITEVTKKHLTHLTLALDTIENYAPEWYTLLKSTAKKMVIFNDPSKKRNSFATQSVHGCAFFNAFQENYNEVFFIEDIAHQCGHVIFNAYLAGKPDVFRIDKNTDIYLIGERNQYNEPRALYVMLHAMYTYESIFTCFDGCLESETFSDHKTHELFGRLTFTLVKFERDYELLSEIDAEGKNKYFKKEGLELLHQFKESYKKSISKWGRNIVLLNLNNQPYNFSYSKFLELNPLQKHELK
jgi:hypothetical protein